jgi:L-arabinonolactonase
MKIEVISAPGPVAGESPVWCERRQMLWWVDMMAGVLHALEPGSGAKKVWQFDQPLACVALTEGEVLLLGLRDGIASFSPTTGVLEPILPVEPDVPGNRLNDAAMARDGRWFVGTMAMTPDGVARGGLYRYDTDGGVQKVVSGLHVTNGLAVSPDNRRLYLSDSWKDVSRIWSFDLSPGGALSNRALFFDMRAMEGRPDGGCMDAEGCYWIAAIDGGALIRLTPQGRVDRTVPLPLRKPSKACFGGAGLKTLFVTSIAAGDPTDLAGAVLALEPGVCGLPEPRRR